MVGFKPVQVDVLSLGETSPSPFSLFPCRTFDDARLVALAPDQGSR